MAKSKEIQIKDLFFNKKHRLLLRAMERDIKSWEEEIFLMKSKNYKNVSSTLIVPNKKIHTYKPNGLIFNPETVKILHASENDSNSYVDAKGKLIVAASGISIDELTDSLANLEIFNSYNEVNFNAITSDILGLFLTCRSLDKIDDHVALETAYMQKLLKDKFKLDLPCFAYFFEVGNIRQIDFNFNTLTYYILRLKNIHSDLENASFYAKKFNIEIRDL
ncbi:MAG: hypothetical protein KR126chlam4_01361 [Candidatus Anoxychlamydiales bacterium]|nr:hypothetical protein [Candidatus Anoxychlamydiales bacterium]